MSRRAGRGLSLVEVLISLAITAMLLTAVAAAFKASAQAIEMNDEFFRASQAARVSVNQMMNDARRCMSGVVDKVAPSLDVTTDAGKHHIYYLDGTNLMLQLTLPGQLTPTNVKLASNVKTLKIDTDGKSVTMLVTVRVGTNELTLSGSALPRRTVVYK